MWPILVRASFLMVFAQIVNIHFVEAVKCNRENTYYNAGVCSRCDPCRGGGFFLNKKKSRTWDSTHGYLDCYNCEQCPKGAYREVGYPPMCNACAIDCKLLKRFESQPCGGANPGHCGNCLTGYRSETYEANDICIKDKRIPSSTTPRIAVKPLPGNGKGLDDKVQPGGPSLPVKIGLDGSEVVVIIAASTAILGVIVYVIYRNRESLSSSICHQSNPAGICASTSSKKHLTSLTDIETDGYAAGSRPELEPLKSHEELHGIVVHCDITDGQGQGNTNLPTIYYPQYKMAENTPEERSFRVDCFRAISTEISGTANVESFFRRLGLKRADFEPEKELWQDRKHKHSDYVYEVLAIWYKKNYSHANLKTLCFELEKANFHNVAESLALKYKSFANKSRASVHHTTPHTNATEQANAIDDVLHGPTYEYNPSLNQS